MTSDDIDLDAPHEKEEEVRNMRHKDEGMWLRQLGEISITEMRINIVPDAKPVRSAPSRAGQKKRELERGEIGKQVKSGIIEPAMLE